MKDNTTTDQALNFPTLPPSTREKSRQLTEDTSIRAAPVICQLITLLNTAGLCEESDDKKRTGRQTLSPASSEFVFFLIWENLPAEVGRLCGRTGVSYPRAELLL